MELVTGKGATDHVSSADMASLYRGLLIADDAVLDTDDKLACTMLDANTAEIGTGDCMLQAHHARVEVAEQLTIRSGSQGFNRNDLIVARYTLGDNNVQAVYLAVIEGTAVAGAASDPAYAEGAIDGGDTLVEFPIWRIPISGVNVGTPERIMPTVDTLQGQIASVRESVDSLTESVDALLTVRLVETTINKGLGSGTYITAPTVSGYKFVCWIAVTTIGWIASVYPAAAADQTSAVYVAANQGATTGTGTIRGNALYVKDVL